MDQAAPQQESDWNSHTKERIRHWFWLPILFGAGLLLVGILAWQQTLPERFAAVFGSLVELDVAQTRLNEALPATKGNLAIKQTFVAQHDGLQDVELTLVRYGDPDDRQNGHLILQLHDSQGNLVVEDDLDTVGLKHNQVQLLRFDPQPHSHGETYTLTLLGSGNNPVSAWGYSEDVYAGGTLVLENGPLDQAEAVQTAVADLTFKTHYRLTWPDALRALSDTLFYEGLLLLTAILLLPLPGCLLLLVHQVRGATAVESAESWDPAAWWGVALALGVAAWPVIWQWLSLIGGRWWGWLLWLVVVSGWVIFSWLWIRERRKNPQRKLSLLPHHPAHLVLLLIVLLGLAARFLAVRDVYFPPWVDSSRHGLITAVMASNGRVISNYEPYLPISRFPYHYGFHTLSASLQLMTNWPLERLLLYLGQLLNGLLPLTMYAAVWIFIRRRGAALLSAFLVALPFFFPAYYTTWGRFTQLTAVLILPVLLALTWCLIRNGKRGQRLWWLVALLAAGLFLVHFRVFVYYLPYAGIVWLVSRGRNGRWLFAAAGAGLLLVLPRIIQLLATTNPVQRVSRTIPNFNNFPVSYFTTGWEQPFVYLAAAGLLITVIAALLRKQWAFLLLTFAAWVASLFLLLAGSYLGLPETSLINLNSMYIMLFVPLAIFLAVFSDQCWQWLQQRHWLAQLMGYVVFGGLLAATVIFGLRQQISILNAQTILAGADDLAAINWLNDNVPQNAQIAVNSWQWLGETWAAADGGAWIVPLNGQMTTTPPIDHTYNADLFRYIREFNRAAMDTPDWSNPEAAAWLHSQGVSHIFVGKRGGFFDPAELLNNPDLEVIYGRNGVFIFAVSSL